jgi:hypothetical protein
MCVCFAYKYYIITVKQSNTYTTIPAYTVMQYLAQLIQLILYVHHGTSTHRYIHSKPNVSGATYYSNFRRSRRTCSISTTYLLGVRSQTSNLYTTSSNNCSCGSYLSSVTSVLCIEPVLLPANTLPIC